MASLLSFVKKKAQQVQHDVGNAGAATFHGLNPLDNGQGYTTKVPTVPQQSVGQQAASFGRGIVHPFSTFGSALIHTPQAIGREIQNKPIYDIQKNVFGTTDPTSIAKQIIADTATVGLTAAAPGLSRAIENPITKVLPKAAPKIISNLAPKVASNATIGGGFGAIGTAGQGGNVKQILKGAGQTALIGGALPLGVAATKAGVKGGVKAVQTTQPLNETGSIGKNVQNTNKVPSPAPPKTPLTSGVRANNPLTQPVQGIPKPLSILKRAALSTTGQLNQLGEGGKAISSGLGKARDISEIGQAQFLKQIPSVTGLSHKEFPQFVDTLDALGRGEKPAISPKIGQAVKEWSAAIPQVRQLGEQAGVPVGDLGPTYFPRDYSQLLKNNKNVNKVAQDLVRTGQAKDLGEAQKMLQFMKNKYDTSFGHFENARNFDLPGYDKSKNALINYISGAYNKIGHAQVFGPNGEVANQYLDQLGKQGHDVNKALDLYQVGAGIKTYNRPVATSVSSGIRTFNRVRSLGLSAILNAGQTTNTASVGGVLRTGASVGKLLSRSDRDFVHSTGVVSDSVLQQLRDQTAGTTTGTGRLARALQSKVTAPGFASVEKFNRSVAAITGRDLGNSLAARGKADVLRKEFGVTGNIGKRLTPEQEIQAGRNIVERTQFKVDPQDLPAWANTPEGKMVAQFRTFTYKQTKFMWNEVIKQAAKGNPLPLVRFMAVGTAAGYVGGNIRGALRGQPFTSVKGNQEGTDSSGTAKFIESLNNVGAFGIGSSGLFLAQNRESKRLPQYVAGTIGGPTVGLIAQTGNNSAEAIQGKPTNLERQGLATIPVAGPKISNTLLPFRNKPKSNTPVDSNGKKLTKGQQNAINPNRQQAWETMTAKAKKNVAINNPDLYIKRQTTEIQKEQAAGQTIKAFKDQRELGKVQIYKNYDKEIGNAYKLSQTNFNALIAEAPDDVVNNLRDLDQKLLDAGLVAKSKFPKSKTSKNGSSRVATGHGSRGKTTMAKFSIAGFKTAGVSKVPKPPRGITVRKPSTPSFKTSTKKLSVSKIPSSHKGKKI